MTNCQLLLQPILLLHCEVGSKLKKKAKAEKIASTFSSTYQRNNISSVEWDGVLIVSAKDEFPMDAMHFAK